MNKTGIKRIIFSPILIRLLTVVFSFVSSVLVNRSLGLELKGRYTTIINYANFIQLILNCGICYIYPTLHKEIGEKAKVVISTLIWIQTVLMVCLSIVLYILHPTLVMLQTVLLSTLLICNSQVVFISLIEDIYRRNIILFISTILYILCNTIAFFIAKGNLNVLILILAVKYIFEIVSCCRLGDFFSFEFKSLNVKIFKSILSVGLPTAILAVLISCNYNIDIFMLNWMQSGDKEIGIYGVAYSLSNMLWILPDAFKELIFNKTAKQSVSNKHFVLKCIAINMFFCMMVCIGFTVLGKIFLNIVYGRQYIVAYTTILVLFIGIIPMVAFKLIHPVYVNEGKSLVVAILLVVSVIVNIISSYFLIPQYGAFGAAVSSVISYSICGLLFFIKYWTDYCKAK